MPLSRRALFAASAGVASAVALPEAQAAPGSHPAGVQTPLDAIVETRAGKVRGYVSGGIYTYKGVPYGAPTAGLARFQAPRPPEPWAGVKETIAFGAICPQTEDHPNSRSAFLMQPVRGRQDEDCLNLNLWTPGQRDGAKRPVMVWIHGGEFSNGSAYAQAAYDGENLARRGEVVVVSVNHRLNALGYLNLTELPGGAAFADAANAGMLDLVAALQWVRDNIAQFGGDPGCVTVFGQSGGGLKITTLCAMPAARGLFHRAIVQSGSQMRMFRSQDTAPLAKALLDELNLTPATMDKLRDVPAEQFVAAATRAQKRFFKFPAIGENIWAVVGWAPTLDGRIIPDDPYAPGNPQSVDVPLMVGCTRHEFNLALWGPPGAAAMTEADLLKLLQPGFGARAPEVLATFRRRYPRLEPVYLAAIISATAFNRSNAVEQARLKAAQGGQAWLYLFGWETPVLDGTPKAYHCCELPFVFANAERQATATGGDARARAMEATMVDAWLAFARAGDPNHAGLPAWPTVTATRLPTLEFNDICSVSLDADRAERLAVGRA